MGSRAQSPMQEHKTSLLPRVCTKLSQEHQTRPSLNNLRLLPINYQQRISDITSRSWSQLEKILTMNWLWIGYGWGRARKVISESSNEPGWRLIVWELLSCHLQNDEKAINYLSLRGGIFSSDRSRLLTEQGGLPMYSASSEWRKRHPQNCSSGNLAG